MIHLRRIQSHPVVALILRPMESILFGYMLQTLQYASMALILAMEYKIIVIKIKFKQ